MSSLRFRILVAHNRYQLKGGEDAVVADEIELLRSRGHDVVEFSRSNHSIRTKWDGVSAAMENIWSREAHSSFKALTSSFKPDVVHFHNLMPLLSNALIWAAAQNKIPAVQTLHNFRAMCLNGLFLRDGRPCVDCQGAIPWRGIVRACYRESYGASSALALANGFHTVLGTHGRIARFIALSDFSKELFVRGGWPENKIAVKPNFAVALNRETRQRRSILYVGRLSAEKGVNVLADALQGYPELAREVVVVGEGPEISRIREVLPNSNILGQRSREEVELLMRSSVAVVVPSICFENFPKVIVESFAAGTPVIASELGAMGELVTHDSTGLLFQAGSPAQLRDCLNRVLGSPLTASKWGEQAKSEYEAKYTPEANYKQLIDIYGAAINGAQATYLNEKL